MGESRGRIVQPVAVFDANVLIPRAVRDLLLSLADSGLYRPVWQQAILDELERNYPKVAVAHRGAGHSDAVKEIARVIATMARAFPDASLAAAEWATLVDQMTCDEKDRHVLAAAVAAAATHVVTENTADFPASSVPARIRVVRLDPFLCGLLAIDPEGVIDAVQLMSDRYSRPPMSVADLAEKFSRGVSAPKFGRRLRRAVKTAR